MYVNLYTRQHKNSLHELQSKGYIINKELFVRLHMGDIAPYFLERYTYFVRMAERRVQRPREADYPIWCSVSKDTCLQAIENTVVYALSVPIDEVIYFDGGKWDYVLNDLYIPSSAEDAASYRHTIEKLSVSDEFSFLTGKYKGMFPEIEKKIRASWERIFTIENWNAVTVQANLWIIRSEYVRHIIEPGEDFYMITADMEETFPPPSSSAQYE